MDYEVELAFIIGTRAKNVPEADALAHVAGYAVCNDISERSLQEGGPGEWIKAKSHDTFGPLGPWLVTTDEIPDSQALDQIAVVCRQVPTRAYSASSTFMPGPQPGI